MSMPSSGSKTLLLVSCRLDQKGVQCTWMISRIIVIPRDSNMRWLSALNASPTPIYIGGRGVGLHEYWSTMAVRGVLLGFIFSILYDKSYRVFPLEHVGWSSRAGKQSRRASIWSDGSVSNTMRHHSSLTWSMLLNCVSKWWVRLGETWKNLMYCNHRHCRTWWKLMKTQYMLHAEQYCFTMFHRVLPCFSFKF